MNHKFNFIKQSDDAMSKIYDVFLKYSAGDVVYLIENNKIIKTVINMVKVNATLTTHGEIIAWNYSLTHNQSRDYAEEEIYDSIASLPYTDLTLVDETEEGEPKDSFRIDDELPF
jgi:hypothetical protein